MCSFGNPSNVSEVDGRLSGNTHEEADALMILHAIDVAHSSPFWHVRIIYPDRRAPVVNALLPSVTSFDLV